MTALDERFDFPPKNNGRFFFGRRAREKPQTIIFLVDIERLINGQMNNAGNEVQQPLRSPQNRQVSN
jgi:hypothetical protein